MVNPESIDKFMTRIGGFEVRGWGKGKGGGRGRGREGERGGNGVRLGNLKILFLISLIGKLVHFDVWWGGGGERGKILESERWGVNFEVLLLIFLGKITIVVVFVGGKVGKDWSFTPWK